MASRTISPNIALHRAAGDVSRPTNYRALLSFPLTLKPLKGLVEYDLLCKTITIPTIINESLEYVYKGHKIPIKGRSDYERVLTASFILDDQHDIKRDLEDWISMLDTTYINPSRTYEKDNTGGLTVTALDWNGNNVISYVFEGVYPSSVSGAEFSGESVGSTLEISVEFKFTVMNIEDPKSDSSILGRINDTIDKFKDSLDINFDFKKLDESDGSSSGTSNQRFFKKFKSSNKSPNKSANVSIGGSLSGSIGGSIGGSIEN